MAICLLAIIFPRASAAAAGVVALGGLLALVRGENGTTFRPARATRIALFSVVALGAWAATSAAWSPAPGTSLGKAALALVTIGGPLVAAVLLAGLASSAQIQLARGSAIAIAVGALLISIEITTDQLLSRAVLTALPSLQTGLEKHITVNGGVVTAVSDANLNRRVAVVMFFLWPAALLFVAATPPPWRAAGLAVLLVAIGATLLAGRHQTSQVAILASCGAFLIAARWRRIALASISVAWTATVLFSVPLVATAHRAELHKADWLFFTARHRIVIWSTTAEEIAKSPIIGVGAEATPVLHNRLSVGAAPQRDGEFEKALARHAHNVYLQTWYELGAVGALLLLAIGLATLRLISTMNVAVQPYALAQFAMVAAMIAFSYGMWQAWFQAAIGLGVVGIALGAAVTRSADSGAGRASPRSTSPVTEATG